VTFAVSPSDPRIALAQQSWRFRDFQAIRQSDFSTLEALVRLARAML